MSCYHDNTFIPKGTQVSRHGTESFILSRGRKCRLKERGLNHPTFRRKQMTQVTYRGVKYDAEEYNAKVLEENTKRNRHDLMYRGLKVSKKLVAA